MLLAMDTCGTTGSLALALANGEIVAHAELLNKTYAAMLVPRVRDLLEQHGASWQDVEAIFVTSGPGSFTGVRIGLSAAKAFAEALERPLIAISRLAVLALKGGTECAALDAGRGEIYFADYDGPAREALLSSAQVAASLEGRRLAACEERVARTFPEATLIAVPTAADVVPLGLDRLRMGDFDDPSTLDGNYLRRSDAELFPVRKAPAAGA